jgi:NAD(P)-dependent dehydrogenase (short-subunit alcohol dehydrogenase family)
MPQANKVVLVTGAASGMGAAVALAFLEQGARVIAADIARFDARFAEWGDELRTVTLDVSSESGWHGTIADVMRREGRLDALVNVAGILEAGGIETVTPEALMRTLDVNTKGVFIGCREAIAVMKSSASETAIVNIASANAVKAQSWTSAYAASKAAVVSLTRTTALHCAEQRYPIRVNAILPGIVMTPMVERILAASPDPAAALANLKIYHPNGRLLEPKEIASVAVFLASPGASGINGASIAVDCGMTAG